MDILATAQAGLQASTAQFSAYSSDIVRTMTTATHAAGGSSGPLSSGQDNLAADLVGQMTALATYRANIRVLSAADRMAKITIDLIG
jgi:hypothetical protein